ncbi:hypothetical protein Val02_01430 [Virgisporangium aliadipatigenens]|uniref:Nucleoside phosphorylase domain-containing protein n=2 Tax=Virgisporangium aliadipatigenens TaxID=741659 RepID=A0A8J4DN73_9ACTN|nr:hypothetical protein Val02_01430 [Virgisporangium aliadipatigenens]
MSNPRKPRVAKKPPTVVVSTVLPVAACAMSAMLRNERRYDAYRLDSGERVEEALVGPESAPVRVVTMRTADRGQLAAALALAHVCGLFEPRFVAMVDVAGSIDRRVDVGDVVIADSVIHYEPRRVTADGPCRRAVVHAVTPTAGRIVQDLLSSMWEAVFADRDHAGGSMFRLHHGGIGSGDAVVTDAESEIRAFLRSVNEKTLAVDTESAGFTHAYQEYAERMPFLKGWFVIRGISDRADRDKDHDRHRIAAVHAADVLRTLLPFL